MEAHEEEITWTIVKGATECSRCKLINSYDYSYIPFRQRKNGTAYWRCSKRNSAKSKVRVNQHGDIFQPEENEHICIANTGAELKAKVTVECINRARVQPFATARRFFEEVIREVVPIGQQIEQLQLELLAQQAN